VEWTELVRIDDWCPPDSLKCRKFAKVKPVRCLSKFSTEDSSSDLFLRFFCAINSTGGPFQSDALLVPHGCQFDHVHNASQCLGPDQWKGVAGGSCGNRQLELRSFAMLLPCGVDVFQGVEFVCCPKNAGLKGV
jgi:amyloid beta A4 protein